MSTRKKLASGRSRKRPDTPPQAPPQGGAGESARNGDARMMCSETLLHNGRLATTFTGLTCEEAGLLRRMAEKMVPVLREVRASGKHKAWSWREEPASRHFLCCAGHACKAARQELGQANGDTEDHAARALLRAAFGLLTK